MTRSAFPKDRRADVSRCAGGLTVGGMSDPRTWRVEYERLLIDEALRRMRRQPPRDVKTWTLVSQMSPGDRRFVAVIVAISRAARAIRRIIRP